MTGSLCRFSADDLTTRSSGRRPQSAKARNRGDGSCDGRAASYGDLATRRDGRVGDRYSGRAGIQPIRSGTNVAKWGFHILSHPRFQRLRLGKKATLNNLRVRSVTIGFPSQRRERMDCRGFETLRLRGETVLASSSRQFVLLLHVIASAHLIFFWFSRSGSFQYEVADRHVFRPTFNKSIIETAHLSHKQPSLPCEQRSGRATLATIAQAI